MTDDAITLNATDIMRLLPHRFPFLLIDKITTCIPGKSLTAIKNVSINEPFFQGHFPGKPIFPGVLIIEAMAQAGGVLSHITAGDVEPKPLYYLVGVDNAKFRHPVMPAINWKLWSRSSGSCAACGVTPVPPALMAKKS